MKILYAVRLFSGLEKSVLDGAWKPTGVPTIFKMIEALEKSGHDLRLVLSAKDGFSRWSEVRDRHLTLDGLRTPVTVLAGKAAIPRLFGRLRQPLRDLRHALRITMMALRERPDIIYVDHASVWAGGILGRLMPGRVVFRVMGVYPVMRDVLDRPGLSARIMRWCYRAPYGLAICSQDGSGIEGWLERALDPSVPRVGVINGCDVPAAVSGDGLDPRLAALPKDRTIVLSVGKLEWEKGAGEFVDGVLKALQRMPKALHALIVGTGSLEAEARSRVEAAGASEHVTFIDRMPHAQVFAARARADIYVSLNRYGNLSNANLEAMRMGQCMVFPGAQPDSGIDVATDMLVPPDAVRRIPTADDTDALADALLELHADPETRARMGRSIAAAAERFIGGWDTRIAWELALLERLAAEGRASLPRDVPPPGRETPQ